MKETIDYILKEIPIFLLNYIKIISSPRDFVLQISSKKGKEEGRIREALIYFSICYIVAMSFTIPLFGKENYDAFSSVVLFIAEALILVIVSVAALTFIWRLFGGKMGYIETLIVYAYQFPTWMAFYLLLNLLNISVLRFISPVEYEALINYSYKGTNKVFPYEWNSKAMIIYNCMNIASTAFAFFWIIKTWSVYRIKNGASRKASFGAGLLFFLSMIIVCFMHVQANKLFDPEAFTKMNFGLDTLWDF
ncbi:MAG: hypothetical protein NVV82_19260 [Sporocytophaga sp.]|nr:hypothetical protein [Sporocytophaga sp.]